MHQRPILLFDSGIGGLSVLYEARLKMPEKQFIYVADDAAFPYGAWQEEQLRQHIITLFSKLIARYDPALCIIACNTASTLVISDLRQCYSDYSFVGTVPAVKPAAEQTRSGLISVLATPGTAERAYTRDLISSHTQNCAVTLVSSTKLATLAEDYLRGKKIDNAVLHAEIMPCFIKVGQAKTDIIVLACTHYPFLINLFRKAAPWPVDWLDSAEAIARRARLLLNNQTDSADFSLREDRAYFTSECADASIKKLLQGVKLKSDWSS